MGAQLPQRELPAEEQREDEVAAVVESVAIAAPVVEAEAATAAVDQVLAQVEEQTAAEPGPPEARPWPPAPVVVRLDGLEVTQEIQDLSHSVPLVAGKTTIVRAYLSRPGSAITVRGELRVARTPFGPWQTVSSLGTAELDPSRAGTGLAALRSRRAELAHSLDFRLPDSIVCAPGALYLRLGRLRRVHGNGAVPSVAHVPLHRRSLRAPVPMRLRLVLVSYVMNGVTHAPSATDVDHLRSYLERAYPVDRVMMTTTTVAAPAAAPFNASAVNAQLAAIRAVDVATGTDARTHYYGMVAASGFFMRGLAAGIPGTPQPGTVASGPTGSSGFSWDTDGSWGDWYGAHELGHTLGRLHAMFCGAGGGGPYPFANGQLSDADEAFVGIDVGDATLGLPLRVMHPITSHDVMSYCDDQWLSSFTYEGVYDRLVAENALPAGAAPGPVPALAAGRRPAEASLSMRVFASVNLDRKEGAISAVLPSALVGTAAPADAVPAEPADTVRARLLAVDGTVLDERDVPFVRSSCEEPDEDVTGTVDAVLPDVADAARVVLLVGDDVVAEYAVGGRAAAPSSPSATRAQAAGPGAQGLGPAGMVHLSWDAAGAPASQRYVVQVSQRDGEWETVAVGLTQPRLDLPADQFDADEISVRILATTGTGLEEVEALRVTLA